MLIPYQRKKWKYNLPFYTLFHHHFDCLSLQWLFNLFYFYFWFCFLYFCYSPRKSVYISINGVILFSVFSANAFTASVFDVLVHFELIFTHPEKQGCINVSIWKFNFCLFPHLFRRPCVYSYISIVLLWLCCVSWNQVQWCF